MAIELKMWIKSDSDKNVELFVRLHLPNFSGQSSAWFAISHLELFIEKLSKYPIDLNFLPLLAGGFWDATGNEIVQEHIYISATPEGNTGAINLCIRLAVSDDSSEKPKLKYSLSANIRTNYWEISEISKGLNSLISEKISKLEFQFND